MPPHFIVARPPRRGREPAGQRGARPLANPPAAATSALAVSDSGPHAARPPEALRRDHALPPDTPREPPPALALAPSPKDAAFHEPREPKELTGYAMSAIVRTGEGPAAPRGPEVNAAGIETAKRKADARMAILTTSTRARFTLSGGFVLPQGTELRSRADRSGHLVFWAGEDTYRIVEPGALRALLGERRMDVAPLSPVEVRMGGDGTHRLGLRTRHVDVSSRAARATFELASLRDSGDGGPLVCRLLLDLMNAPPSTAACATDEVPLHAELHWTTQGALYFDVTSLGRRADLAPQDVAAPPASSTFDDSPPPEGPGDALLTRAELAAFRSWPGEMPVASSGTERPRRRAPPRWLRMRGSPW